MGANRRHAAHVDPDRREDSHGASAVGQPLVAGTAVCDRSRPTTSTITRGTDAFDIEFDFPDHQWVIRNTGGSTGKVSRIASTIRVSHGGVDGDRITIVGGYEDEIWLAGGDFNVADE